MTKKKFGKKKKLRIVQLVEHQTKKAIYIYISISISIYIQMLMHAIAYRGHIYNNNNNGFFNFSPLCAISCINISAHVKNLKHWQPHHCLHTLKYCTH